MHPALVSIVYVSNTKLKRTVCKLKPLNILHCLIEKKKKTVLFISYIEVHIWLSWNSLIPLWMRKFSFKLWIHLRRVGEPFLYVYFTRETNWCVTCSQMLSAGGWKRVESGWKVGKWGGNARRLSLTQTMTPPHRSVQIRRNDVILPRHNKQTDKQKMWRAEKGQLGLHKSRSWSVDI